MRFDRTAPGGGMVIYTKVENGKCLLEFQFFYEREASKNISYNSGALFYEEREYIGCEKGGLKTGENVAGEQKYFVEIIIYDMQGEIIFQCRYPVEEEEPAKGLLLHPHLWNGIADPYLYKVKCRLMCQKPGNPVYSVDKLKQFLPLRRLEEIDQKGWHLNGKPFEVRGVLYNTPFHIVNGITGQEQTKHDLELLQQMGANTIYLTERLPDEEMITLCEQMGFVVWCDAHCSPKENVLTEGEHRLPTDRYFYYKACWSKEPFVHILSHSLKRQENGNYSLTVYSNQKRVALYVNGVLFEFRVGAPEYVFEEIPAKKMPLLITVEAGECRKSETFYL